MIIGTVSTIRVGPAGGVAGALNNPSNAKFHNIVKRSRCVRDNSPENGSGFH